MSQESAPRTHVATFEWREQGPIFATRADESGLSYLQGLVSGEIVPPPVAQVLGIEVTKAEPGAVQFTMPVKNFFTNHLGFLAGGILSTVIDSALGCSILASITPDKDIVTLDLNVDFLRPVSEASGLITVDAEVVHLGRNRGLASCRAVDSEGRLCAVGKSSCLVRDKPQRTGSAVGAQAVKEPRR
ncbi:PaaI family thioesterase [Streptomyces sp. SP18CS02]|uniref:PaaI family thioesterase n=1 Tax=Streptomyces sp. SP18CS02 TaxID=3002531 RepID=UPI002E765E41|nr:PaaI family thioesterase [Streptomyces sp. SP18CS02]MEE1753807.1 PaaI family thioesterase [Streptomyces sp. SP18CS02]